MPAALEYLTDPSAPELRALEEAHAHEYDERAKRFAQHWNYYEGVMPAPLKTQEDGVDDNIMLPKIGEIADKVVSFLIGDGLQFDAGGDGEQTAEDDAIAALWDANRGNLLQHNIALSGALSGHCFARIEPRPNQMPRIVNLNPAHCSVFWDAMDVERVLWYRLQYTSGAMGKRIDYVRGRPFQSTGWDHEPDSWYQVVYYRKPDFGTWQMDTIAPAWEHPFSPVVEWQNLPRPFTAYGSDDVRKAIALNNSVNFIASNWARILKHYADPKTVGIGFDLDGMVSSGVGGLYVVNKPKSEAEIYNLEMKSDMSTSQELLGIVLREMWQTTRLVDPQTVKDQVGKLTNFGLRVMYADTMRKVETKQLLYEEGLTAIIQRALAVAGQPVPATVNVTWPDVLPEDEAEQSAALLAELAAQVLDKQTYCELRGYDFEQIQERLKEESAGQDDLGTRLLSAFEGNGQMMRRGA